MKTNTHGLRINGLKKVAGESKSLNGYYLQLNYNIKTGEAWTDSHASLGQNSWTNYNDANVINCGNLSRAYTMQEIADRIDMAVKEANLWT